tara:strand:+ start:21048 stop:22184 length:1137 start_codon:yes stop_codon:yes gene_type:complete
MKKYLKIILNIFRSFSLPIFSFTLSILGIRFFGKQNWGEFIFVLTIINFFAFLGNFGNKDFLLRKYSNNPSNIVTYFSSSFSSRIFLLLASLSLFFLVPNAIALLSILLIFLIYTYQSFDSLIIYQQKFLPQLIAEIIGFIIIVFWFLYDLNFELSNLLFAYIISYAFKMIYVSISLKNEIRLFKFTFSIDELKKSFPFFLIIFSGWMASKIDVYIVNFKLSSEEIAEYQLGISAFLMLQSLSYLIILPFNKHIYRLQTKSIKRIKIKLGFISIPIIVLGTFSIWILLEKFASINLPPLFYFLGAFASIPTFFFIVDILVYYKDKKENKILIINLISTFINFIFTYFLISRFGIIGAITSVLITQYTILIFYKFNLIK